MDTEQQITGKIYDFEIVKIAVHRRHFLFRARGTFFPLSYIHNWNASSFTSCKPILYFMNRDVKRGQQSFTFTQVLPLLVSSQLRE